MRPEVKHITSSSSNYVFLSGADGSGKTTVAKLLVSNSWFPRIKKISCSQHVMR